MPEPAVAVPESGIEALPPSLAIASDPESVPAKVGAYVTVNDTLEPAGSDANVAGAKVKAAEPVFVMLLTDRGEPPVLAIVTD